jgi:hypothetical protein
LKHTRELHFNINQPNQLQPATKSKFHQLMSERMIRLVKVQEY